MLLILPLVLVTTVFIKRVFIGEIEKNRLFFADLVPGKDFRMIRERGKFARTCRLFCQRGSTK